MGFDGVVVDLWGLEASSEEADVARDLELEALRGESSGSLDFFWRVL